MNQTETTKASGQYRAACVGPVNPIDGQRIVDYVAAHPELVERHGGNCNLAAAAILGISVQEHWNEEVVDNVVTIVGRNLALDTFLAGSAYTVTGPYLGLISSASYGAGPVSADTMASHAGWTEAGNANAPTYTAPRKTAVWSAASGASKSLSAALAFAITGTGTVKGAFLVYGSGAVSTIDNTSGTLYSAGLFGTGDRAVLSGDTLNVSWTGSM